MYKWTGKPIMREIIGKGVTFHRCTSSNFNRMLNSSCLWFLTEVLFGSGAFLNIYALFLKFTFQLGSHFLPICIQKVQHMQE